MDWIITSGTLSLGLLIGAIVGWYWSQNSVNELPPKILLAAISALAGSSVLAMFSFLAGLRGPTREYWFYPIGLLVGCSVITIIEIWYWGYDGKKQERISAELKRSKSKAK